MPVALQARIEAALSNSLSWTFIAGSIAAALCLASSLPIRERSLDGRPQDDPKAGSYDRLGDEEVGRR